MVEKTTITFFLPIKLKSDFEEKISNSGMDKSTVLRQLIHQYIEDDSILTTSAKTISRELESRLSSIESEYEKRIQKRYQEFDRLVQVVRDQFETRATQGVESLEDEIYDILTVDTDSHKMFYRQCEAYIIEKYPHLQSKIEQVKLRGSDPVGKAINRCRDEGLVKYHKSTKRLTWVKT